MLNVVTACGVWVTSTVRPFVISVARKLLNGYYQLKDGWCTNKLKKNHKNSQNVVTSSNLHKMGRK